MEKNSSNLFTRADNEMYVGIKASLSLKNVVTLGKEVN